PHALPPLPLPLDRPAPTAYLIGYNVPTRAPRDDAMTITSPAAAPVAQSEPILLREDVGRIAVVTLNRPRARNSLSEALLTAPGAASAPLAADRPARAVVLAATGPAFSAGHDMKERPARRADPDKGRGFYASVMLTCSNVMQQIVRLPQPVIAAVQGTATAAG